MRDAMRDLGGDPARINPLLPAELVIDHSVQVDEFATARAIRRNAELEFERNRERYAFLRWGQGAFDNFKVVPPNTGIVHQVNLEYLARVVEARRRAQAFPDTLVGTDSHTTMVNGLGVLGWGVGGIEAEAAMLGEAISMLVPQVVGFRLTGALPEGATATDLVLTVTQILRARRASSGSSSSTSATGLAGLPLADRATIGNMSPEYGATCGFFPVDEETLELPAPDRPHRPSGSRSSRPTARSRASSTTPTSEPTYSQVVELDLGDVEPSLAGPRRPQDRVPLREAKQSFLDALAELRRRLRERRTTRRVAETFPASDPPATQRPGTSARAGAPEPRDRRPVAEPAVRRAACRSRSTARQFELEHGAVVIAAITSCTNTSNPAVMIAAGLLAKNAVERGLSRKPWVKSSLAPGSKVVTEYYEQRRPDAVPRRSSASTRVGYGCTTCIGNSGPLPERDLAGGRRGRPRRLRRALRQPQLRGAHPPGGEGELPRLAAARRRLRARRPDGHRPRRASRSARTPTATTSTSRDLWPSPREVQETIAARRPAARCSSARTPTSSPATSAGARCRCPRATSTPGTRRRRTCGCRRTSTGCRPSPGTVDDVAGARCLVMVGDSVTTDHISPAGSIKPDSPAGRYLIEHGVERKRLQLVRLAARQPRGDGARHVRERPPAQPARPGRARARGRCTCRAARR